MAKRGHHHNEHEDSPVKKTNRGYHDTETRLEDTEPGDLHNFFSDSKMIDQLRKNGFKSLFPIQQASFHTIVKGRDMTARDRTGSGKTLAYTLPALQRLRKEGFLKGDSPKMLVMVPTRELVLQVRTTINQVSLEEWRLKVVAVYGGDDLRGQLEKVKNGADVIVATPGRLIDFINRGVIRFQDMKCLVLDEADEMLKAGFQEDIENIFKAVMKDAPEKPQTLLFSATMPSWVKSISEKYQESDCEIVDLVGNSKVSVPKTIRHFKYPIDGPYNISETVKKICKQMVSSKGRVIIFCETKREVTKLNDDLQSMQCAMLHGDVKQRDRERVYADFKSGKVLKVVATNVAARGLDFPNIEMVIQVEPPKCVESYIHRSGRTGRAGKEGKCVVLLQRRDRDRIRAIEDVGGFRFQELCERDLKEIM